MKIIFVSDTLCHHQIGLCDEIYKLHTDFEFIETAFRNPERINLGMEGFVRPYCVFFTNRKEIKRRIKTADVIIAGSVSARLLLSAKKGTKIYKYSERLFKKSFHKQKTKEKLQRIAQNILYRIIRIKNPLFLLAASAYAPNDFYSCKIISKNNMFRFGYFPNHSFAKQRQIVNNKQIEIVWCNRMIDWKHPEFAVELGKLIKKNGLNCHVTMIGGGIMFKTIEERINKESLSEFISLLGFKPATEINHYLTNAEISIYTSDRNEGWGVGVSESMAAGCITIASEDIGCVPYLIKDSQNGYIYRNSDLNSFLDLCLKIIIGIDSLGFVRQNAVQTISDTWSPKEAARRLIDLVIRGVVQNDDGPCSTAPIIKNL